MEPVYCDDMVTLYAGDCIEVLRQLPDASVDSVVTDPPYGLSFMGKAWDDSRMLGQLATGDEVRGAFAYGGSHDRGYVDHDANGFQVWSHLWARECLRVLKPGGHLLAFGGTRTWHRLACAIEDAGFEVRDSIAWMYGSGFPKSLDVSKAIDKAAGAERGVVGSWKPTGKARLVGGKNANGIFQDYDSAATLKDCVDITAPATPDAVRWSGWGTALKPAHEPIVVARKPLTGTVAANVLEHGVGGLNIDGCRIGTDEITINRFNNGAKPFGDAVGEPYTAHQSAGRWPANVILDEDQADALDQQSGNFKGRVGMKKTEGKVTFIVGQEISPQRFDAGIEDFGGASRFFYVAKAPTRERPKVDGIAHPTVKPLKLMRWLCRLVTPPGGTVLEPFAGSGTTVEAATAEGFKCIAIERELDYLPLILSRITRDEDPDGGQLTFDASA